MPATSFVAALALLFEGAPRFLERLAADRPFGSDEAMLETAARLARELPEEEAVELVNAHPRIGTEPASVSGMSFREQGYDREAEEEGEENWAAEELKVLNEVYEARFGFRFAVFVAGREQAEIIPLIEAALRNDREAELRRAVDDCIDIAADRLSGLRGEGRVADESAG